MKIVGDLRQVYFEEINRYCTEAGWQWFILWLDWVTGNDISRMVATRDTNYTTAGWSTLRASGRAGQWVDLTLWLCVITVCKYFVTELKSRLAESAKSKEVIETGHGIDKPKRFKYLTSCVLTPSAF